MRDLVQLTNSLVGVRDSPIFTQLSYHLIEGGADITIVSFNGEQVENKADISNEVMDGLQRQGLRTLRKKVQRINVNGLPEVLVRFDTKTGWLDFHDPNIYGQISINPVQPKDYSEGSFTHHLYSGHIGFRNQAGIDYPQLRTLRNLDQVRFFCLHPKKMLAGFNIRTLGNFIDHVFPEKCPIGEITVRFNTALSPDMLEMAARYGNELSIPPVSESSCQFLTEEAVNNRKIYFESKDGEYWDRDWIANAYVRLDVGESYTVKGNLITTKMADLVYIAREGFDEGLFTLFQKLIGELVSNNAMLRESKYKREHLEYSWGNAAVTIAKGNPIPTPEQKILHDFIKLAYSVR